MQLSIDPLASAASNLSVVGRPAVDHSGPAAYSMDAEAAMLDASDPLVGPLLHSGTVQVVATGGEGELGEAGASSSLADVQLRVTELSALLTLEAAHVTPSAAVEAPAARS